MTPYHCEPGVTLYVGDAREVVADLPDGAVDCVVTSPPYWGLRDYGTGRWVGGDPHCMHSAGRGINQAQPMSPAVTYPPAAHRGADPRACARCGAVREDRQYGLEASPEQYVQSLRVLFGEIGRVLSPRGCVWLNLGDSYYSGAGASGVGDPTQLARRFGHRPVDESSFAITRKSLLGMPWRVAFALQSDGWILRNAIVWHKPNAMPESVRDRLACRYEMLFLLTRSQRYWFDLDPIREPLARPEALGEGITFGGRKGSRGCVGSSVRRRGLNTYGKYAHPHQPTMTPGANMRPTGRRHAAAHPRGRNPGDVWSIPTRPYRKAHFATFPIDLPLRCIAAGCPPDGTVLDPFSGAGTTALAARQLGRSYVGVDLNPRFHDLAKARLVEQQRRRPAGGAP